MSDGHGLTIVWAFDPLEDLQGETGFVECDEFLAARLIREGRAQDPQVGALLLKPITQPGEYATRVLKPGAPPPLPAERLPTDAPPPPPEGKRGPGRPARPGPKVRT